METSSPAPPSLPSWKRTRAQLGHAIRWGADPEAIEAIRADFTAARLGDLIRRTTAGAPQLKPEHLQALHAVLDATQGSEARR